MVGNCWPYLVRRHKNLMLALSTVVFVPSMSRKSVLMSEERDFHEVAINLKLPKRYQGASYEGEDYIGLSKYVTIIHEA